ncbi:MAG: hypothetical protein JJU10_11270 [Idiomarina sp.]|nr:hypothetical protein [Idiomarina sp.]
MMNKQLPLRSVSIAVATALMLSACGSENLEVSLTNPPTGGGDHDHDHSHDHDSTGRLVITQFDSHDAHVLDLASEELFEHFHLASEGARLYVSPQYRYALAVHRDQGVVQFIDGGLHYEDHGDHHHEHEDDPELLSFELFGELPTHYDYYLHRGAVFFDGLGGVPARVDVLSDMSISDGDIIANLELARSMHGAAEVRGHYLFTSYRSADAPNSLPNYVEVYERHGDHFDFIERFEEPCPGLHGSAISSEYTLFGCTDGVLVIQGDEHDHGHSHSHDEDHEFTAMKIANPEGFEGRIGSIWSHPNTEVFVGRAGQELYRIHVGEESFEHLDWRTEENADATILGTTFNFSGNRFGILDSTGHLTIIRFRGDDYEVQSVLHVLDEIGDVPPVMTANKATHDAYITDPEHNSIIVVDMHDGVVEMTIHLDFQPERAVWVGIGEDFSH